jgi:hypothetical protein
VAAVIEARGRSQDLPLVPTLLCLFGANWIGGIAGEFVGGGPVAVAMAQVRASYATLLVVQVASALVGAVAVRYLLRTIVGCEVTLGSAIAALLAGALVTMGGEIVLVTNLGNGRGLTSAAAVPVLFVLAPIATFVSYLVLQHTRPVGTPAGPYLDPYPRATDEPATVDHGSYDVCVDAVRETSAGLVETATRAHLDEVADIVLAGLPYLEAATDALERATPPTNVPPQLHRELVDGARTTHEELLTAARQAALGDDPRLRLADSRGMRQVRHALRELAGLRIACDW